MEAPRQSYDADDTLSFCDFSLYNDAYDSYSSPRNYPDTPDSLFEFFIDADFELDSSSADPAHGSAVVFCGKTIEPKLVQRDPRNGLFLFKTNSFKRSHGFRPSPLELAKSSQSFKLSSPATGTCKYQSSKSRKRKMVLIGSLSKPQPRMELSDIKRRQSRRSPKPMFPVAEEGSSGELVTGSADTGRAHHKCLLRAHLVSALAKASFGCIPSPRSV